MDPLSVLREFAIDRKLDQVVADGTRIKLVTEHFKFSLSLKAANISIWLCLIHAY